ncbi:MAG: hypothetical protein JXI43_12885 [Tissierellales bacterium]|nr:hypothetical protein [Tissierellales bacterium]
MARRKRIIWDNGSIFGVPLVDGSFGLVQAIDHWMPHWIYSVITSIRINTIDDILPKLSKKNIISLLAIEDDVFDFGGWPLISMQKPLKKRKDFPNEKYKSKGYVGAKSYTRGIIEEFISAFHLLSPWDVYKEPDYFDRLLVSNKLKPEGVLLSKPT